MIKRWVYVALAFGLGMSAMSCENQKFNDVKVDVDRVHVDELSPEMIKVRDYVPEYAVIAHRGSTFWTPEETESAYRGREKSVRITWNAICRCRKTEWYWHYMTIT